MRVAQVALDIPASALDSAYSYGVPENIDVHVGCAVLVPWGQRCAIGFVVRIVEFASAYEMEEAGIGVRADKLRPIMQCVSRSYFNEDGASCAQFLSDRYLAPLSSCVRLFTPPGSAPRVVRSRGTWVVRKPQIDAVDDRWVIRTERASDFVPRKNAVKQRLILESLEQGELRMADLTAEYGQCASSVKALERQGVVKVVRRRRMRGMDREPVDFTPSAKPDLIAGQRHALDAIDEAISHHDGHVVVVDGVTGSGKTEVYLQAIEHVLREGKNAIVLVPEISLTPQTVARFRGRFGDTVAVMHSRMSAGERYDQWDFIKSGEACVVVGARSALFTPIEHLGLIVIDEEHEGSYKQDSAPRYASRDVALWIAKQRHATLVLGSATPSITTLYQAEHRKTWTCVELPERVNGRPMPSIEVVDMSHEFGGGNRSMFSRKLKDAIRAELANKHKVVLFLNQRGFAKFLLCRECGFVPQCPNCSSSLTYHEHGHKLVCHHCGYEQAAPARCPKCGSPYLRKFGAGTQRVEAELTSLIQSFALDDPVPIIRMDYDTTRAKGAHQRLLDQFGAADAAVLLGTQMIAKGLDFDDVTLVGVINADTELHLPDFNAEERTFQLIEQVAGRAGRAGLPGRVLVQTYSPHAISIQAAAHYDRAGFLRRELPKRKELKYPPYVRMACVLAWGAREEDVRDEAQRMWRIIQTYVNVACGLQPRERAEEAIALAAGKKPKQKSKVEKAKEAQETLDLFSLFGEDSILRDDAASPAGSHARDDVASRDGDKVDGERGGSVHVYERDPHAGTGSWEVFPAVPCPLGKVANKYRYHIVIKAPADADIAQVLGPVFRARKAVSDVHVTIDIDPESLV